MNLFNINRSNAFLHLILAKIASQVKSNIHVASSQETTQQTSDKSGGSDHQAGVTPPQPYFEAMPQDQEPVNENEYQNSMDSSSQNNQSDLNGKDKKVTQAQMMGKTAGRWTKEEHKKFVQALKIFGKDWKRVEDYVMTRSGAQIRSHAQKYFIRIQKKLKGNSAAYLNQSEDQCNTNKGLELFRQTITLYEEGAKDDANEEDDDELSCMTSLKRQKISDQLEIQGPTASCSSTNLLREVSGCLPQSNGLDSNRSAKSLGLKLQTQEDNQSIQDYSSGEAALFRMAQILKETQQPTSRPTPSLLGPNALQFQSQLYQVGDSSSPSTPPKSLQDQFLNSGANQSSLLNNMYFLINEVKIWLSYLLSNQRKQIQSKFGEIVRRKELIVSDIYFNDNIDLFIDGRKYLSLIQVILNDIQHLSQKLTIINQSKPPYSHDQIYIVSGLLDPNSALNQSSLLLERLLILINEVVNLQKVLLELVNNNELFNKTLSPSTEASTANPSAQQEMLTNTSQNHTYTIHMGHILLQNHQAPIAQPQVNLHSLLSQMQGQHQKPSAPTSQNHTITQPGSSFRAVYQSMQQQPQGSKPVQGPSQIATQSSFSRQNPLEQLVQIFSQQQAQAPQQQQSLRQAVQIIQHNDKLMADGRSGFQVRDSVRQ